MFNMMLSSLALVHSYEFLWVMCSPRRCKIQRLRYLTALSLLLCRVRNIQHSLMHNVAVQQLVHCLHCFSLLLCCNKTRGGDQLITQKGQVFCLNRAWMMKYHLGNGVVTFLFYYIKYSNSCLELSIYVRIIILTRNHDSSSCKSFCL